MAFFTQTKWRSTYDDAARTQSLHVHSSKSLSERIVRTESTTLVVGAAGAFAGLVVPELAQRGVRIRGFVRDARDVAGVRARGAAEVAVGDLTSTDAVQEALRGVTSAFYIAPAFMRDEADVGTRFVEAARSAGVRRLVFSSVIHPVLSELENHGAKAPVEDAILDSDMEYTFLHPAMFYQNFASSWDAIAANGTLAQPWSTATRFSHVDYRDVAEVAATALTEDRLLYGTFELCGDEPRSATDVAQVIGEVLGRAITAERRRPPQGSPQDAHIAEPLRRMFDWYDRHGLMGSALTLRAVLKREPRTLRSYFEELHDASRSRKANG